MPWSDYTSEEPPDRYKMFKWHYNADWASDFNPVPAYARILEADTFNPWFVFNKQTRWPADITEAVERAMCKALHTVMRTNYNWTTGRYVEIGADWVCWDCGRQWPWFPKLLTLNEATVNALAGRKIF